MSKYTSLNGSLQSLQTDPSHDVHSAKISISIYIYNFKGQKHPQIRADTESRAQSEANRKMYHRLGIKEGKGESRRTALQALKMEIACPYRTLTTHSRNATRRISNLATVLYDRRRIRKHRNQFSVRDVSQRMWRRASSSQANRDSLVTEATDY